MIKEKFSQNEIFRTMGTNPDEGHLLFKQRVLYELMKIKIKSNVKLNA